MGEIPAARTCIRIRPSGTAGTGLSPRWSTEEGPGRSNWTAITSHLSLGDDAVTIAREAGMGIATAYRHFPTKNELVEAVLATQVDLCSRAMRSALAEPDPWEGLRSVIDWFTQVQIAHPGLLRVLLDGTADGAPFTQARREHAEALDRLVGRALEAGALRPGVTAGDVRVGMLAMTAFSGGQGASSATAVRALSTILVHGISGPG
ncbi:TetR/AcrR family transcriptional regulator [Herbiconiux solani]|uniref:TetR/AcrR family transcriptional regulator n=1 Tax=Herbiconiux solani TaxID=661329 RepID=UPI002480B685